MNTNSRNLAGKVALVTGASRSIGAAIAKRLAADGAAVAITYSSSPAKADEVVRAIEAAGGKALAIQADAADEKAVRAAVSKTVATFGGLDILVNNAGTLAIAPIEQFKIEDFDKLIAVNVRGLFVATQEASKHLRDGGRIIHIGSVNADRMPFAGGSVYALTKGAVAAFTKGLARDLGARQDTSGDKFIIELEGQQTDNRGIAGELILRRAEKLKNRFGDDVRIGRFAGFDLFLRPSFNNTVEVVVRGKNSYAARVTDTAQGTIRSLETTVQGFDERAARLEADIADAHKRGKELESKVGAPFEHEERYQHLSQRQSEIEEQLDLTKNQAPSQVETVAVEENELKNGERETVQRKPRVRATLKP